jgi:hypothetical protein
MKIIFSAFSQKVPYWCFYLDSTVQKPVEAIERTDRVEKGNLFHMGNFSSRIVQQKI